jgi:pimeloyl-ACP methyl ester carboxylesterase
MTWAVFADALRQMTLGPPRSLRAPLLIHRAYLGDFDSFAAGAVASNRGLRSILRLGFTLSITCAEDVPRIDPARIPAAVAGTYMGDTRVREQMEACEQWGMGKVPAGYGDPVRSDVPVFLLSGTLDPATPPHYGTEAARYLSRSIHVIVPGGHAPRGECITAMERAFLEAASPRAVDTTCVRSIVLPPFAISDSS